MINTKLCDDLHSFLCNQYKIQYDNYARVLFFWHGHTWSLVTYLLIECCISRALSVEWLNTCK